MSEKSITMDGSPHGPDECRQDSVTDFCGERVCVDCKVVMHWQSVYGGYYYECPECGETDI